MAKKRKTGKKTKNKRIKKAISEINALKKVERFAEETKEKYETVKKSRRWLKILDALVIIIIIALIISAYTRNFLTLVFFLLFGTGILFYILIRLVANRR